MIEICAVTGMTDCLYCASGYRSLTEAEVAVSEGVLLCLTLHFVRHSKPSILLPRPRGVNEQSANLWHEATARVRLH